MKYTPLPWLLACCSLAACSGSSSDGIGPVGGQGELVVEITDKPFAYDLVVSAIVRVDEIRVHNDADGQDGFVTLYSGKALEFDLLDLTNGVTEVLVRTDIPVGTYHQLRLHVVGGRIELIDGDVFSTELGNLQLTSTGTSGLKVFIDPPIEIVSQASTTLLLDFDLSKTFHAVPANDALNASKFLLKPVLHAVNLSLTGEVSGVVSKDDGTGTLVGVEKAAVYLQPFGDPDPQNSIAATSSAADGSYKLIGVPPGTWDALAIQEELQGTVSGVEVAVGNVSFADVVIQ
jgi:Domain of unknown function (DUF4382)